MDHSFILRSLPYWYTWNPFTCSVSDSTSHLACVYHLSAMAQPRCHMLVTPHPAMIHKWLLLVFIMKYGLAVHTGPFLMQPPHLPLHCAVLSVLPSCVPTDRDTKGSMYSPESRTGFHLCVFACALPSAGIASAPFVSSVRRLPRKCNRQNWQASQNIQLCSVSLIYVSSALCESLWPQPHNSLFSSFSCMEMGTACVGMTNLCVQYIVVAQ